MNRDSKIAVTVVTGFLGAGKTTFINQLLKNNPETQFALVENEFGEVSIDTKLIKGVDASQMFELRQGCICCTISDEYEMVLAELAERFPNVQHLLIETTGIADPTSVIRPFFSDDNLKNIYKYNGTICLVDAVNFENQIEKDITIKQLIVADRILITRSENWLDIQKNEFKIRMQKINPFAEIRDARRGVAGELELYTILQKKRTKFDFVGYQSTHSHIQTKTLLFSQPLVKDEFVRWLSYTLDIYKKQIYRTKGILCFKNEPYECIMQGVGGSFEITEGDLILTETKSELVFIGILEGADLEFS